MRSSPFVSMNKNRVSGPIHEFKAEGDADQNKDQAKHGECGCPRVFNEAGLLPKRWCATHWCYASWQRLLCFDACDNM